MGRWHAWVWLAVAVITPTFLIGTRSDALSSTQQFWLALAFGATGAVLAVAESRRGIIGREAARVDRTYTLAYVAAMIVAAVAAVVADTDGPPAWFVPLALVPSVPCLVAAWRILRS